jgi:glycolate oxidase FAD binding subunit
MKFSIEQLVQKVESELGAEAVTIEPNRLATYAIDSMRPALFCSPDTPEQCAAVLRFCAEADAAVTAWGSGTAIRIGNLPRQVDVVVGLARLNRVVDHDHANLTVTVQSGITLAALHETLAKQDQFLAFDPPQWAHATIGGVTAANLNGPRRAFYGSVRDLVIGMKVALASGEQIKAGGKVVKNVAGYDMCKLFVGSLGTLGIITEVTVRLLPVPRRSATFTATGSLSQVFQFVSDLANSPLLPASLVMVNAAAAQRAGFPADKPFAAVRLEGFEETVLRQIDDAEAMAKRNRLDGLVISVEAQERLWEYVRDFSLNADRLVYRLTVQLSKLAEVITSTSERHAENACMIADAASGTLWFLLEPSDVNVKQFTTLISLAHAGGGHAVVFAAPSHLKQAIDVWGAAPPSFTLMRGIKQQFDPKGLLNPGRFAGGI